MVGYSALASGNLTACGTTLPSSAAMAVLIATATCAGPVPADAHFNPSPPYLPQNLRKPFSVSPPNGTYGCLASIIACTTPVSPPCAVIPSNFLCTAIASAVTFCAVGSSHLPMTSTTSHFLPDFLNTSWMPSCRSRSTDVPETPRTSSPLPPFGPVDPEAFLVDVDVDCFLGVEDVVERDQHDARVVGALDHRLERRRILRVDDDRVVAGVDEVVDGGDLRGDVLAGGDDLEL